jgi:predicted alpha/beta hydrolase
MKRHAEAILWAVSFLSLIVAAMTATRAYLFPITLVWIVSTVIVIPLHFYRAWRRWRDVPNKRQYAAWVGLETLAALALIGLFVYAVFPH